MPFQIITEEVKLKAALADDTLNRALRIAVLDSGYVSLTSALFADVGFHVITVDVKAEVLHLLQDELIFREMYCRT
jgi:UDP-N-acetyl-D-mannosaminuronate dehydrogenase